MIFICKLNCCFSCLSLPLLPLPQTYIHTQLSLENTILPLPLAEALSMGESLDLEHKNSTCEFHIKYKFLFSHCDHWWSFISLPRVPTCPTCMCNLTGRKYFNSATRNRHCNSSAQSIDKLGLSPASWSWRGGAGEESSPSGETHSSSWLQSSQ